MPIFLWPPNDKQNKKESTSPSGLSLTFCCLYRLVITICSCKKNCNKHKYNGLVLLDMLIYVVLYWQRDVCSSFFFQTLCCLTKAIASSFFYFFPLFHNCLIDTHLTLEMHFGLYYSHNYLFQIEVFRQQLELAKELKRPASIHCVRAFGDLLQIMKYAS